MLSIAEKIMAVKQKLTEVCLDDRLVNYMYFQAEQLSSIGSGAVESAVKQIDKRLQIVGAQWKYDSIPYMLSLRCAYLNSKLAPTTCNVK